MCQFPKHPKKVNKSDKKFISIVKNFTAERRKNQLFWILKFLNRKKGLFCIVYKTQNCHTFGATAAAECMTILRFVNIQKGPLFSDIKTWRLKRSQFSILFLSIKNLRRCFDFFYLHFS